MCETLVANSGRERTSAFCYAVGWTQHTVGVQTIRTAAIVQQLLGNIGRPGGGILALRGHASIQGSTDIPTLYNILPGYLPMPHTLSYATLSTVHRLEHVADRLVGEVRVVLGEPDEGVLRRERDRRERLAVRRAAAGRRATTPPTSRSSRCSRGTSRATSSPARTPPSATRTARRTGSAWRSSTGSSCATSSRSSRRRSGTTAPRSSRAS